jgi:hypothetical protein
MIYGQEKCFAAKKNVLRPRKMFCGGEKSPK